ncbi:Protein ASPARTIC PROTEASE IN GUARD CELL 2 [Dendrobium catenatum]|uniref:Protein ASPARTIC PROTEASE IN GUARD CELL 2 n=1 Tax=Dendrobium catenatum TaxID=906689 RepID=A0A2I0X2R4_9ASPA|nr:Protein ASPARTIC PROTEASE IN GUARD CELL 2 [Dendrobium catenatum]
MFDTGSDLTWTQCVPCINCHNQNNPFYDPTQSSTFTTIECISNYCTQLPKFDCSSTFTCLYEIGYADHCMSKGSLIKDTLKFSNANIQNFNFGCGDNNTGYFGHVDGYLGLGRGFISIISQTSKFFNNIFSYCLPSGPDILDSGTPFSRLPPTTYFALRSIFRKKMSNYLMAPPLFNLDTCYDLTNIEQVVVPNISFVYEGEVTTNLDISGILFQASDYQWCLSIVGSRDNSELIIIGSMQQRRFNVVFDVGNSQIGFGINGCS